MGKTKQMNIKNRTYYFYDEIINIKNFDPNLLKLDKKTCKDIAIYYIGYFTKKDEYKINSVYPIYLLVHRIDGFIEEKEGNKYLNVASTDRNSEILKKYAQVFSGIKDQIEKITDGKSGEYDKDHMKIKFSSDNDFPLSKQLNFLSITIIIRNIFEKDGKYYPQIVLDECLYEV